MSDKKSFDVVLTEAFLPQGEVWEDGEWAEGTFYLRAPRGELFKWARTLLKAHGRSEGEDSDRLITVAAHRGYLRELT